MSIKVEELFYTYLKGSPFEVDALRGINLEIKNGEFIGLVGHTGCGKSTLIQHFNGLLHPSAGKVFVDNIDIFGKGTDLQKIRSSVGIVFQYPEHQLFEETVFDDIAFGPKNFGVSPDDINDRVRSALSSVGLDFEAIKGRSPFTLSGGEKRRIAIAGILAFEPSYIILDEPTAGLDPRSRDRIISEIKKLREKKGKTIILVTHDMNQVAHLADRIFIMEKGKILKSGNLKEVFSDINLLEQCSLDIPDVTRLMHILHSRGIDVNKDIFTVERAYEEIKKFRKR